MEQCKVCARDLNWQRSSLEPALEEQAQADMALGCLHSIMTLPPEPQEEDASCWEVGPGSPFPRPAPGPQETLVGVAAWPSLQLLYLDSLSALEELLRSLLRSNMTPQGVQVMVEVCAGTAMPLTTPVGPPWAPCGLAGR